MSAKKESARTTNSNEWLAEQEIITGICDLGAKHNVKIVPNKDKAAGRMYLQTDLESILDTHAAFVDELKKEWKASLKKSTGDMYHIEVARPRLWSFGQFSVMYSLAGLVLMVVWFSGGLRRVFT